MRVRLWGVRGSLPTPTPPEEIRMRLEAVLLQFERLRDSSVELSAQTFLETLPTYMTGGYGGNTSCAEITSRSGSRLLIDAGSGLKGFSEYVMQTSPATEEYHLYFTHFHWDHMIGLPFFVPLYMKGKTIHIYAVHDDLEDCLKAVFRKPNFPVPYEAIKSQLKLHKLEPRKKFSVGDIDVTPYKLDHPDPCWGARVESGAKSLAWAVDTECTRGSREQLGPDAELYRNADLMVFDAQYSFTEALEKINWGHGSAPVGLDLAIRENVKMAIFAHHDPAASDEKIYHAEEQTRHYYSELIKARRRAGLNAPELLWRFAREGEVIEL